MATYRFLAYDLRTNVAIAELPLADVRFGGVLNGVGSLSASCPLDAAGVWATATTPERTIIYVERDGVLLEGAGYIVWGRRRSAAADTGFAAMLSGAQIPSYLRRNRLVATATFAAIDQLTIARALVTALQAQPGGDIGINVGTGTSGVLRDRTYPAHERKNIGDALAQLAEVSNGFDWAVDVAWSAGAPSKSLTLSYPRRGRIAGSTGIVFQTGKNLLGYDIEEDGSRSARSVDTLGAGDGSDQLVSTATRTDLIDAGYPLTAETLAFKDVSVQATLDEHAIAAVNARAATPQFWRLTVAADDVDGGLGHWIVGDDCLLVIDDDPYFPRQSDGQPGYLGYHRIVEYSVSVPTEGVETVEVILGHVASA